MPEAAPVYFGELLSRLKDPSLTIVNVMSREAFAAGHIPGSVSLPVADIGARAGAVLPDPQREIVVHCGSPTCPLASQAADLLTGLGYTRLRHFHGGMAEWIASGQQVETGPGREPAGTPVSAGGAPVRPALAPGGSGPARTGVAVGGLVLAAGTIGTHGEVRPLPGSIGLRPASAGAGGGGEPDLPAAGSGAGPGALVEPLRPGQLRPSARRPVSSHAGERLGVRAAHAAIAAREKALGVIGRFLDRVASLSFNRLIAIWGAGVLGCGALYWMIEAVGGAALIEAGTPLPATARGFVSSVYFSFVTATSLGYGDIVPVGLSRFVAILEGAGGLLLFGCVISKLVSHRQEILIEEIHRSAFESRLSRVRTNLHLMLSELQGLAAETAEGTIPLERLGARLESAAMVFGGELRSVHDLLYRPQQAPDEEALEALLANLAAGLREFCDLMDALPQARERSEILHTGITSIAMLASEICGECVPREYAPGLKIWMDRIQQLARRLSTA